MRTILNGLVIFALANLFAALGFVGWLGLNDRLSMDRVKRVGEMFGETVSTEAARLENEAAERQALLLASGQVDETDLVPLETSELLQRNLEANERRRQELERLGREVDDLKATLQRERADVDRARQELEAERTAFEAERAKIREIEGSAQFEKALAVLKNLKPDKAWEMLTATLGEGEDGMMRVIEFLNALPDRQRSKIVAEFIDDDATLAADLLERLRTRGLEAPPTGGGASEPGG